ncbi:hypothetical protein BCON_0059g00070 [Botryotinia convoluta]|uniref:Uncharacterized protein n=1 Tax=Botryotinia convoluta TaxID=54673 RepID=A0A4Z1I8Y6_9HELO|nr:hypothetical protein BCON_0059g00070 [Botryotinia convoluta]
MNVTDGFVDDVDDGRVYSIFYEDLMFIKEEYIPELFLSSSSSSSTYLIFHIKPDDPVGGEGGFVRTGVINNIKA